MISKIEKERKVILQAFSDIIGKVREISSINRYIEIYKNIWRS
jgi:hypothetical protein